MISNISFFTLILNPTYFGWMINSIFLISIGILGKHVLKNITPYELTYLLLLLTGTILHYSILNIEKPYREFIIWTIIIILIPLFRLFNIPKFFVYLYFSFFIIHMLLSIYEMNNQILLFNYNYTESFSMYEDITKFRSFSLMEHPLRSANIVVIALSFVLVNRYINNYYKVFFLVLGTISLLCFNSRAAIITWGFILILYYLLFTKISILIITLSSIAFVFFSGIIDFSTLDLSFLGRLAEEDNLSNSSSITRLLSYYYFWHSDWDLQNVIVGGRIIYIPGTNISLENGILLTISWWGWIVGILKVLLELIISYNLINIYNVREKFILLFGCWGCAFANNNNFNTFVFAFFIISVIIHKKLYPKNKNLKPPIQYNFYNF